MSASRAIALVLAVLALGCGGPDAATPTATVDAYFRDLGRDPIRTLPLLSPAFHEHHGLGVVTAAEAQRLARGDATPATIANDSAAIDRLQLGWLAVQSRDSFRSQRDRWRVTPVDASENDAIAQVVVRVEPSGVAPFEQRFTLSRADGAWRIDAVEQTGVVAENRVAAFVAHPNEVARRQLAQQGTR